MDHEITFTLEQEFSLKTFADQVQQMSLEQAQAFLVEQYRLMIINKILFQEILKQEWKIGADFASL